MIVSAVAAVAAVEEEEIPSYEFDEDFQRKITILSLRDSTFVQRTEGLIRPEYFISDIDASLQKLVLDYFGVYRKAPDKGLWGTLIKEAVGKKQIRKDLVPDIVTILKDAKSADVSDRDYVIDQVAGFARHRAIENALMKSVDLTDRGDYDKIEALMRAAVDVGASDDEGEYDYWAEVENRTEERKALVAGTLKPDGITTGSAELDKYLYHSGWGRKELSVIMGAAKAGKSMSLGEFGKNASLAGYNVLYVTLEVSSKIIADRTDANVSETAMRLLKDNPYKVEKAVKAASARAGRLIFREFPSGTFKASQLRRLIERYRTRGIIFDLIIVDYADIMAPERFTGELRDDMRAIYIDLRAIASIHNAAVLTATQTNREGAKAAVAKMTDVAEDFNKIRTADLVLSINATEPEKAAGEARIFFAASRNNEGGFALRIKQSREQMRFLTKVLGRE